MATRPLGPFVALLALLVALLVALPTTPAGTAAPVVPPGFSMERVEAGQGEFNLTDFVYLPNGGMITSGKNGRVAHVSANNEVFDIATVTPVDNSADTGLVGIDLARDFLVSKRMYAVYTYTGLDRVRYARVASWTLDDATDPRAVVTETAVVDGIVVNEPFHSVGTVHVAPDNTIWFTMGDGGTYAFPDERALRALDLDQPHGKLMHVNPDGTGVASTNPWYNPAAPSSWQSRIYAKGFRNPFRFTLHPDGTPYLGDVGWSARDEVNVVRRGGNYGWPCFEGRGQTDGYRDLPRCRQLYASGEPIVEPLWARQHSGTGNSITGGVFVTGPTTYPEPYRGSWFFGDYVEQRIWTLETTSGHAFGRPPEATEGWSDRAAFASGVGGPVAFRLTPAGEVAYADIFTGEIVTLRYGTGNRAPVARASAQVTYGDTRVPFRGDESYDRDGDPITYLWDFGDGTTSTERNPVHTYAVADTYTATLRVTDNLGATATDEVLVPIDDREPELAVVAPPDDHRFAVGDQVALSATAADVEDADLGSEDVGWRADIIHHTSPTAFHVHPGRSATGASFMIPLPDHGPESELRVLARIEDSAGHVKESYYTAKPLLRNLTATSSIGGPITVNGHNFLGSGRVTVVAGSRNVLTAPGSSGLNAFDQWSDGREQLSRFYFMPRVDSTVTAHYRPVGLDVRVTPGGGPERVLVDVTPTAEPGDLFHSVRVSGCAPEAPRGDDGNGQLAVGETWTYPCRVASGSYPGQFMAEVSAVGPHGAIATGRGFAAFGPGYRMVATDGGIFTFGGAGFAGSMGGQPLNAPVVGMSNSERGYRMVASDGGIFSFGDASFLGSMGGQRLNSPIVGMAATPSGNGYWMVAADGGIFTFGDAAFLGSMGGHPLPGHIVGMGATPTGNGYWLAGSDGSVYAFGDAVHFGSMGGTRLARPIVGIASTPDGNGYWLVATDGGIFTFGNAGFLGSMGGKPLNKPIIGMTATPSNQGYYMVATDGGIFTFGDAAFYGSMGGTPLNRPVVGMSFTLSPQ